MGNARNGYIEIDDIDNIVIDFAFLFFKLLQ